MIIILTKFKLNSALRGVLLACAAILVMAVGAMAQTGATVPVDLTSTITTSQAQILAYLPTILAAAAAVTVAFTGAKVFMKWLSSRAKSS